MPDSAPAALPLPGGEVPGNEGPPGLPAPRPSGAGMKKGGSPLPGGARWVGWPGRLGVFLRAGACFLLPALAPGGAGAQGTPAGGGGFRPEPRGLAVALEMHLHHQQDELVSPLRYSGVGFGPGLRWGFSTEVGIRSLTASYGSPRLPSSATEKGSHYQEGSRAHARLTVLHRVGSFSGGRLAVFLGGALAGDLAYYRHWYTREDKERWIHAFALAQPGVGWRLTLPRGGQLWQEVTFPLMGVAVRPGYEGLTEAPKAAWVWPVDLKGVDQALHYLQPLGRRLHAGITYAFAGLTHSEPQDLTWTRHSLSFFVTLWRGGDG